LSAGLQDVKQAFEALSLMDPVNGDLDIVFTESRHLFTESRQVFTQSCQLFTESRQLFTESRQLFTESGSEKGV
jgi:tRNA U34 5-methylaminomethyl-2-thiouridine-forming methyltransferase MnmC